MLHQNDLIFCKTESGVTSCGYNISNMLLKNTLHMPSSQYSKSTNTGKDDIRIAKLMEDLVVPSGLYYCHPMTKHKVFNYKLPQSSQTTTRQEKGERGEKGEKGDKNEINITNGMLDDSVYDKLLSLVSTEKRKFFDRKTRKNKTTFQKIKDSSMDNELDIGVDKSLDSLPLPSHVVVPKREKGEKGEKKNKTNKTKSLKIKINTQRLSEKQEQEKDKVKQNQRKTKKVRFADDY